MPKESTLKIQHEIMELGNRLGFISCIEERIHNNDIYAPIYDAVWYLDLTKYFDIDALKPILKNEPSMLERIKKLPVAGFEIEGASTSSKNQLGNFGNLYSGNFLYNFVIVNNGEANGENDTYRRGRKIYKYFYEEFEAKNTIFMDYTHLRNSISHLRAVDAMLKIRSNKSKERINFGGDITSTEMFEEIRPSLEKSGMELKQNYSPQMPKIKFRRVCDIFGDVIDEKAGFMVGKFFHNMPEDESYKIAKKQSDMYYIPKLDVVIGFDLPDGFVEWLYNISTAMKDDYINFPILYALKENIIGEIFVPVISIEFENSINKHCNGGIINMSHYSCFGILMGTESAKPHIEFLKKNMGINNVTDLVSESAK